MNPFEETARHMYFLECGGLPSPGPLSVPQSCPPSSVALVPVAFSSSAVPTSEAELTGLPRLSSRPLSLHTPQEPQQPPGPQLLSTVVLSGGNFYSDGNSPDLHCLL